MPVTTEERRSRRLPGWVVWLLVACLPLLLFGLTWMVPLTLQWRGHGLYVGRVDSLGTAYSWTQSGTRLPFRRSSVNARSWERSAGILLSDGFVERYYEVSWW